jgi:hypothetical protein
MRYGTLGMDVIAGKPPSTGWTPPTIIYERMRDIDISARALDANIHTYVKRQAFLDHWNRWYDAWRKFFKEYQGVWKRVGAITYTDHLAAEVEAKRQQLSSFEDAYEREGTPENPTPSIPGGIPAPPVPVPSPPSGAPLAVPWWVWTLGGMALVGGGYYLYRTFYSAKREIEAKRSALESVLPRFLEARGVPPELTQAAVAHDPPSSAAPPIIYDMQAKALYRKV